ncbi:metallophosphoesterase [bacterium]|nr:metallophosphoesterase [bacterium]
MNKIVAIPIFSLLLLLIDWYVFQGVEVVTANVGSQVQSWIFGIYWGAVALVQLGLFIYHFSKPGFLSKKWQTIIMVFIFTHYLSKSVVVLFLIVDDLWRLLQWVYFQFSGTDPGSIARSPILAGTGLALSALPMIGIVFGIFNGAHDYRVRRQKIYFSNLPEAFDGLKLAQISDIHAGSFWSKPAVKKGVKMLMAENPDLVCFTGDLVNNRASEMDDYKEVFSQIKAPLGVFSILGNHDYGDYVSWPGAGAKAQNLQDLVNTHREMGWDILLNEHRILKKKNEKIAVLGIENWGAKANFPKYGIMTDAYAGMEEVPFKILLSHDPSHWDAEVVPSYTDIDLTLSGHTHGMQFGLELPGFRWSPVQYVYKKWGGLYQQDTQYLYINRGFGYLGYPGRIGMPPEITILELKRGKESI